MRLLSIFLIVLIFRCHLGDTRETSKEGKARKLNHPLFIQMKRIDEKSTKQISLNLTIINLSPISKIRNLKILLFALDKNGLILIPEHHKTPELICQRNRSILTNTSETCSIGPATYGVDVNRIIVHSVSLSLDDGIRHHIDQEEIEEIIEWK